MVVCLNTVICGIYLNVKGSVQVSVPLDAPGHGHGKLVLFAQDVHQVLSAGRADGPERV